MRARVHALAAKFTFFNSHLLIPMYVDEPAIFASNFDVRRWRQAWRMRVVQRYRATAMMRVALIKVCCAITDVAD